VRERGEVTRHGLIVKEIRARSFVQDVAKSVILPQCHLPNTQEPIERDERVDLRESLSYVSFVSLNHAPSDEEPAKTSGLLQLRKLKYAIDTFFDRTLQESAGVNHCDIRSAKFVNDLESGVPEDSDHDLGIDLILGAAKGDDGGSSCEALALTSLRLGDIHCNGGTALCWLVSEREDG
jgi:hypothetical protein